MLENLLKNSLNKSGFFSKEFEVFSECNHTDQFEYKGFSVKTIRTFGSNSGQRVILLKGGERIGSFGHLNTYLEGLELGVKRSAKKLEKLIKQNS